MIFFKCTQKEIISKKGSTVKKKRFELNIKMPNKSIKPV